MAPISLRGYVSEIEGLIDSGKMEEAIAHCLHILKTYSMHIKTYQLLGKAYLESHEYTNAADIFQRILNAVPDDFIAHVGMSIIKDDEGNLNEAIWHMERAYEVQPSNPAIQGELRRLFGKRDGVEPAKIRLSREALANMYAQGELYNQAIAEIRAILVEDPERPDLQVMLARSYFQADQKVEAAEMATHLLKKYPYCVDALRILVDILPETTQADNIQIYRQRLNSLDPYSSHATDQVFKSDQIPDSSVTLEKLDFHTGTLRPTQSMWTKSLGINLGEDEDIFPQPEKASEVAEEPGIQFPATPDVEGNVISKEQQDLQLLSSKEEYPEQAAPIHVEQTIEEGNIPTGDMPEWLKSQVPAELADEEKTSKLPDEGVDKEFQGWLSSFKSEQETPSSPQPMDETQPSDITTGETFNPEEDYFDEVLHKQLSSNEQKEFPDMRDDANRLTWLETLASGTSPEPSDQSSLQADIDTPHETHEDTLAWLDQLKEESEEKDDKFIAEPERAVESGVNYSFPEEGDVVSDESQIKNGIQADLAPQERIETSGEISNPEFVEETQKPVEEVEHEPLMDDDIGILRESLGEDQKSRDELTEQEEDISLTEWLEQLDNTDVDSRIEQVSSTMESSPPEDVDLPDWLKDLEKTGVSMTADTGYSIPENPGSSESIAEDATIKQMPFTHSIEEEKKEELITDEIEPTKHLTPTSSAEWQPEEDQASISEEKEIAPPQIEEPVVHNQTTPAGLFKELDTKAPIPSQEKIDSLLATVNSLLGNRRFNEAIIEYNKLIKRGKYLDEIIHDIHNATTRYPEEIHLWQVLGDAFMKANRLQDALDAYSKAEELLG